MSDQQWPQEQSQKLPKRSWWKHPVFTHLLAFFIGGITASGGDSTSETATSVRATDTVTITATNGVQGDDTSGTTASTGSTNTVTATTTKKITYPPKTATAAERMPKDGVYEVGVDIHPGKWKTSGGEMCYWERQRSTGGGMGSIISNSIGSGQQVVTIKKTDAAFKTKRCGTWVRVGR